MDLYEIIRTLHEEHQRVDRIIRRIQELQEPAPAGVKARTRRVAGARKNPRGSARRAGADRRRRSQPPNT